VTSLRIDRLLWFLRLVPSRSIAARLVETGHIRIGGGRVTKPATPVQAGDVLTLPLRSGVRVLEIIAIPTRRGPACEAAACYRDRTTPRGESDSQRGEMIDGSGAADLGGDRGTDGRAMTARPPSGA
jgi:ribosome-associated heat shock protein Hsp15